MDKPSYYDDDCNDKEKSKIKKCRKEWEGKSGRRSYRQIDSLFKMEKYICITNRLIESVKD